MKLAICSHKACWLRADGTVATNGGFPFQMRAIAELFSSSVLLVPGSTEKEAAGLTRISAPGLEVRVLSALPRRGWRRRLGWVFWILRHGGQIWRAIGRADAVHTPVPSDVALVALLLAKMRGKFLLVRHCGTWGARRTLADRWLRVLLPRLAGGRTVVLATGGGAEPPAAVAAIEWIFATTLRSNELDALPVAKLWQGGDAPRLISVGRLDRGKNVGATLEALAILRRQFPAATLEIVGDGPERARLEEQVARLGLRRAVHFHGNLSHEDVLHQLTLAHLFVFPTQVAEGFPKAVVEALAAGVPVIGPAVSVIPELIFGCGVVLPDTRSETVARAIADALADPEDWLGKAREARKRARLYTLEAWQESIANALERHWHLTRAELQGQAGKGQGGALP